MDFLSESSIEKKPNACCIMGHKKLAPSSNESDPSWEVTTRTVPLFHNTIESSHNELLSTEPLPSVSPLAISLPLRNPPSKTASLAPKPPVTWQLAPRIEALSIVSPLAISLPLRIPPSSTASAASKPLTWQLTPRITPRITSNLSDAIHRSQKPQTRFRRRARGRYDWKPFNENQHTSSLAHSQKISSARKSIRSLEGLPYLDKLYVWARTPGLNSCQRLLNLPTNQFALIADIKYKKSVFGIDQLVPGCHSTVELVSALQNHVGKILSSSPTPRQVTNIQFFRKMTQSWTVESPPNLERVLHLLDEILFDGKLRDLVNLEVAEPMEKELHGNSQGNAHSIYGMTLHHHMRRHCPGFDHAKDAIPPATIQIGTKNLVGAEPWEHTTNIETVVHETIHAFLGLYGCGCGVLFQPGTCHEERTSALKLTDHGKPFQACEMVIQEALWRLALIPHTTSTFAFDRQVSFFNMIFSFSKLPGFENNILSGDTIRSWVPWLEVWTGFSRKDLDEYEIDLHAMAEYAEGTDFKTVPSLSSLTDSQWSQWLSRTHRWKFSTSSSFFYHKSLWAGEELCELRR